MPTSESSVSDSVATSGATDSSSMSPMNSARSLICMAEHSAMLRPLTFADSAAALSRAPPQSGHALNLTALSTNARMCGCIDSRSLARKTRRTLTTRPS
jgi:hypothetical protein